MRLMRPMGPMSLITVLQPCTGHTFTQTAFFDKILLQSLDLLVHQVVGLVNQAKRDIRNYFGRTRLTELAVHLIGLMRFLAKLADILSFLGILVPNGQVTSSQKIAKTQATINLSHEGVSQRSLPRESPSYVRACCRSRTRRCWRRRPALLPPHSPFQRGIACKQRDHFPAPANQRWVGP